MTIGTTNNSNLLNGNGVTTVFPFTFTVPSASDIVVTYTDTGGIQTILTGTQYSVALNAAGSSGNHVGGSVTCTYPGTSPLAAGTSLLIARDLALVQTTSISNQGPTFAAIESALDYLTMSMQQDVAEDNLAIVGNPADPVGLNYVIPPVSQRANLALTFDVNGNVAAGGSPSVFVSSAMAPVVGAATVASAASQLFASGGSSLFITGSPSLSLIPIGLTVSTLASAYISSSTSSSTLIEYALAVEMVSNTGFVVSPSTSVDKIALYAAVQADSGSGNVWAFNAITVLTSGACTTGGAQTANISMDNNSGVDFSTGITASLLVQPAAYGLSFSGVGTNAVSAAVALFGSSTSLGGLWNAGVYVGQDSTNFVGIKDEGQSTTSTTRYGYILAGHYAVGIDAMSASMSSNVAVRIGPSHEIAARKADNSANVGLVQMLGTTTSVYSTSLYVNSIFVGDSPSAPTTSANAFVLTSANIGLAPANTNVQICGSSSNIWSAIWATNGTIQTSDPTLKTDIRPLSSIDLDAVIAAVEPIAYRWIDGGGGKPGKRQHWGWDAAQVEEAFKAVGEDFGGFVQAEDGSKHLRPDQLVPVLWQETKNLRARLAAVEAR